MIRKTATALGLVLCFGTSLPAHANEKNIQYGPAERLARTFEDICLRTLPYFLGATERLKALGFELTQVGDQDMFELWNERLSMGGHIHLPQGDREPACGFLMEKVKRQDVGPLVEAILVDWLGKKPERGDTGDPDTVGWQVPAAGSVLHIAIGTSLSDDPAQGASVTVEVRKR